MLVHGDAIVERSREMIAAGSLPTRADCARCGLETSETVDALAVWHIEMAKPEPDGLLGALCMISPKIRYSLTRHVEVVTLRFRVRLCPFCRWANAERSLRPRLFSILVFVIGACAVYWALWGFLLMAISLGIWVVEVSVVEQRRQSTLLGILHHEPIYKQVLEDCSPPVVSVVGGRVAEQPPQQWPPFASN